MKKNRPETNISRTRIVLATIVFIGGFFAPLLIPLVTASNLSTAYKSTLSGLLAFGIPELAMLVAAGIAGKEGFELIKSRLMKILSIVSPDRVSKTRYTIGLVMFSLPLVFGFIFVYIDPLFEAFLLYRGPISIILDIMFVISIFVLGGNFWDKLRSLFIYSSSAQFKHEKN